MVGGSSVETTAKSGSIEVTGCAALSGSLHINVTSSSLSNITVLCINAIHDLAVHRFDSY